MGKITGFLEYQREEAPKRPIHERVKDWKEVYKDLPVEKVRLQGARCMDCGVPFCHTGCPLNNLIPDWNDLVYRDHWRDALRMLHATNNFPEFTGRLCPAPCEASCVLGINEPPVAIKQIEKSIIEYGFKHGWVRPEPPERETGKRIAIVGSGPAGLAAAQQLRRVGHDVTVFEKADRIGGLLRYGIPDFKMEKWVLDRRLEQLYAEGIKFVTNAEVGGNVPAKDLLKEFDAVLICCGAENPRKLDIPGSDLKGIHYAMDFLIQQNRRLAGDYIPPEEEILATDKNVVIIGGGDTGADCLGTCHRQKARIVYQFEHKPAPPKDRHPDTPWPLWPYMLRVEPAHEEGGIREWAVETVRFEGDENGHVRKLHCVRVEFDPGPPRRFIPIPGSEFVLDVDLVLVAAGFRGVRRTKLTDDLGIELDEYGRIRTDECYMTNVPGVFAAGDAHVGASLIVTAIAEGRKAAREIDRYLMGKTVLP